MPQTNSKHTCEEILNAKIRYNNENNIFSNVNVVARHLLTRHIELLEAYEELCEKLNSNSDELGNFFDVLLSVAISQNPSELMKARRERDHLHSLNQQIEKKAYDLAQLLDERSELNNSSSFHSNTHYSICAVIDAAANNNHKFQFFVKDRLSSLRGQFDLSYWPTLGDCVLELSHDAARSQVEAIDPLTEAATGSTRNSLAGFFRAWFTALDKKNAEIYGLPPRNLKLTDNTYAALANCALNLGPNELVDGAYVKQLRHRDRNSVQS